MSFLASLSHADLQRLRRITKQVHMSKYPKDFMTDREADRIIEAIGPEVVERMLRRSLDGLNGKLVV